MSLNRSLSTSLAGILIFALVITLSACGLFGGKRDDAHQGATAGQALEIPPDLLPPELDATYRVPAREDGRVSAVETERRQQPGSAILEAGERLTDTGVAPQNIGRAALRREGGVRWLELQAGPESIWQGLRNFWREQEFELVRDEPALGIMETEWKETQAGVPVGGFRRMLSRTLGTVYDAGTRDQYRIRLERETEGVTALYLSHRGVEQVVADPQAGGLRWAMRPSDPELEAEMLAQLMIHLGHEEGEAREIVNLAADEGPALREREVNGQPGLELRGGMAQVWRRVGLGLDRAGLLVDDQDRQAGVFHVTYSRDAASGSGGGFFSRLFRRDPVRGDGRYQIHLAEEGEWVRVTVKDREGDDLRASDAASVLELFRDELY